MLLSLGLLAAQAPVKITVNTQLVVETVSVTDKNGKPVEGITAKDFVVTEDGVVQTVSFCEYQKMQEVAPAPAPAPVADQVAPVTRGQIAPERPGDVRYKEPASAGAVLRHEAPCRSPTNCARKPRRSSSSERRCSRRT